MTFHGQLMIDNRDEFMVDAVDQWINGKLIVLDGEKLQTIDINCVG